MLLVPNFTGEGAASPIRLRALSLGAACPVHHRGADGSAW